jgi:ribosomal protein L14E/L6E/L27E
LAQNKLKNSNLVKIQPTNLATSRTADLAFEVNSHHGTESLAAELHKSRTMTNEQLDQANIFHTHRNGNNMSLTHQAVYNTSIQMANTPENDSFINLNTTMPTNRKNLKNLSMLETQITVLKSEFQNELSEKNELINYLESSLNEKRALCEQQGK